MSKIKLKARITSTEKEMKTDVFGIFDTKKNTLKYLEEDKTKVTMDINNDVLIRENDAMIMNYNFDLEQETLGDIYLKELNQSLNLGIKTTKIEKNKNKYYVEYELIDNDRFIFEIIYEEVK